MYLFCRVVSRYPLRRLPSAFYEVCHCLSRLCLPVCYHPLHMSISPVALSGLVSPIVSFPCTSKHLKLAPFLLSILARILKACCIVYLSILWLIFSGFKSHFRSCSNVQDTGNTCLLSALLLVVLGLLHNQLVPTRTLVTLTFRAQRQIVLVIFQKFPLSLLSLMVLL